MFTTSCHLIFTIPIVLTYNVKALMSNFSVLFVYVFFYQVVLYSDNDNGTLFPYK